jgi:hypothetical protein
MHTRSIRQHVSMSAYEEGFDVADALDSQLMHHGQRQYLCFRTSTCVSICTSVLANLMHLGLSIIVISRLLLVHEALIYQGTRL